MLTAKKRDWSVVIFLSFYEDELFFLVLLLILFAIFLYLSNYNKVLEGKVRVVSVFHSGKIFYIEKLWVILERELIN